MEIIKLTKDNFEQEVLKSEKPVLVDFYADWCGPCQMLSPIVDEVAEERDDIKVGKINVDEQMELAQKYGVMTIPTLHCDQKRRNCEQAYRCIVQEWSD